MRKPSMCKPVNEQTEIKKDDSVEPKGTKQNSENDGIREAERNENQKDIKFIVNKN